MRIKLLTIGKTDNGELQKLIDVYLKRLKHYVKFELVVLPDIKNTKNLSASDQMEKEAELILKNINSTDTVFLLDENGKEYTSVGFANQLQKHMNSGIKEWVLVIGGPYGFSDSIRHKANGQISLSKMTFSHQMVRLFIVEQIYRAFTILRNEPYHHK
ncbi:23S rRNA (pseudouridine(1915)-N(3))-methyltransferase RlmH [uncultured Eudoraea sp.]|jgi:23S rRNA (pseudouridine1915-N3)-methyltransferase|uniref:23S rRNA (pseudouridine(1915)-N(3))-methyltransferase RlmH n=1 Tax=uncultured Eudoraea sp. TaxID=1035614 RepID=UPI0026228773|nr:23S rRNA (pseudouridine(1915)-N(3))-methyltransferase RlmH [uncultured Eudoraea sp.]